MKVLSLSFRSFLGRAVRLPLKMIPPDAQVIVLKGRLRGKKWIRGASADGCWLGTSESNKQNAFAKYLKPGDSVYDIGANVGYYTILAGSLVGPTGKVFAFEPVPRNLAFLRKHLELNQLTNCTIYDVAVGEREGTAPFDVPNPFTGHLIDGGSGALTVKVVSLDGLVAAGKLPPPNLIKMDIEGGEYIALQGAIKVLADHRPTIFLATHSPDVHKQCCQFLRSLGYQLFPIGDSSVETTDEIRASYQA